MSHNSGSNAYIYTSSTGTTDWVSISATPIISSLGCVCGALTPTIPAYSILLKQNGYDTGVYYSSNFTAYTNCTAPYSVYSYYCPEIIIGWQNITISPSLINNNNNRMVFVPTSTPYTITKNTTNYVQNTYILVNTGSAYTITLPPYPLQNTRILVKDLTGTANTHNITVSASGTDTITNGTISVNNACFAYVYSGSVWTGTETSSDYILINSNDTYLLCSTVSNSYTLYLPSSPINGTEIIIKDAGNAGTNNVTVNGNGVNIDGSSTYVISSNYGMITLMYSNSQWFIVSKI
jgi:hypothetical protein